MLEAHLGAVLAELEAAGLRRWRARQAPDAALVDVCTNDYLGYARAGVSRETVSSARPGAGASRHIHGTHPEHLELEAELAGWVGAPAATLFPSGYAANVGAIAALIGPDDLVVSDRLNHASLIDGCRLSRATVRVTPHANADAIRDALTTPTSGRKWLVTESYFSMDGTSPDLRALRALADEAGASLYVDEAHALGVFGPHGAGLCARDGVRPDVLVGTLGKAVGVQGAFVAGSTLLADFLWNRARSLVFTTAPSPLVTAQTLQHVRAARADDGARDRLRANVERLEGALAGSPITFPERRHGPIFPALVGSPERALTAAEELRRQGFLGQAIRPPTVPPGSCRLRVTVHADHTPDVVHALGRALVAACAG